MANIIKIGNTKGAGGVNETLPTMPEDFLVLTGDEKADLSFTVPTENYGGAIIVRKLGSVPNSPKDGVVLQASSGTCEDVSLINGEKYYWRLYPYNEKGQYQTDLNGAVVYGWPLQIPTFEYTGSYEKVESYHPTLGTPRYYAKLRTSGTLTFNTNATVDVFCVGGGGSGAHATVQTRYGGGGGRTTNSYADLFTGSTSYSAIIGAGGNKTNGGNTAVGAITATGGNMNTTAKGGDGGSGGGGFTSTMPGAGGTDGGSGTLSNSGLGQGTTTRPFGGDVAPFNSMQFAGGGGGGGYYSSGTFRQPGEGGEGGGGLGAYLTSGGGNAGYAGAANTGGGGGGGGSFDGEDGYGTRSGGAGGSGVVIIRVGDWSA